jgi:hypothetical protein
MDGSTSEGRYEYPGDIDAAAGGASDFLDDEDDSAPEASKDLKNLRALDLRELARRAFAEAEADLYPATSRGPQSAPGGVGCSVDRYWGSGGFGAPTFSLG